ncbi:MAG: MFS transporter [Solirubrobacteraceae bacterium]|nr:MFS transporter [Solirubrobacteraceae bacterium]
MLSALQVKAFRRLAALYPLDGLLEWSSSIALMVLVYDRTGSALATGALLVCKQIVPGLLTPLAGRRLDAAPIGATIAMAMLVRALAVAGAAAVGYGAPLFVLALVAGLGGTLSRAAFRTGVARTLHGEQRRSGNALLNVAMGLVSLGGPAAAGLALTAVSARYLLDVSAVIGLACAAAALLLAPGRTAHVGSEPQGQPANTDAKSADDPISAPAPVTEPPLPVPVLLVLAGLVFTAFAMDEPSLLPYAEQSLGEGVGVYGAILSCWGLGIIIGSVAFSRVLDRPMITVGAVGTAIAALGYLGLGLAPNATVAFAVAIVGGIGNGFNWVALVTAVQESTPAEEQGQAATRLEAIATVGPGVGYLIGGLMADAANPRLTLIVPGVFALAVLAGGLAASVARARRREPARALSTVVEI